MLQHVTRDLGGHNFMVVSDEDTLDIATVSSQLCLEHQVGTRALVGTFNQEKALVVGAFSMIVKSTTRVLQL